MSAADWSAIRLSLQLAAVSTLVLMLIGIPLAWWLCRSRSRLRPLCSALVTLPMVLPPTVLGFYLLMLLAPQGSIGKALEGLGLGRLPFTFGGLVAASVVYSLPFVVQPLQVAFNGIPQRLLDAASSLRARPLDRFFSVVLPLARPGLWSAAVLGFAHTVGEFGVVLMIGGNIPDKTRVVSIALYEHFEAGELPEAHRLAAGLLVFALFALMLLHAVNRPRSRSDTA
jgi:molybdate transport system permease protein